MRDGFMELYDGKRHIHTFCAEANVWYYKKALDYKFWSAFIEAYVKSKTLASRFNDSQSNEENAYDLDFPFIKKDMSFLKRYGFYLKDRRIERNVAILNLIKNNRDIELRIQKRADAKKYYIAGKRYAISIGKPVEEQAIVDEAAKTLLMYIENEK
jgi:hypothetical protein